MRRMSISIIILSTKHAHKWDSERIVVGRIVVEKTRLY
jgi:hypothetical protein